MDKTVRFGPGLALALTCAALSYAGAAFADEAPAGDAQAGGVQEVVVTALRQRQTQQQTPATVDVLDAQTIARAGVHSLDDIAALSPGVSVVDNAAEVGDAQVNIRGLNGARDAEPNYAFVLDGILETNAAALNRQFVDLQQIEVLEGPQGAIYGRNAEAGAIVVTTKLPTDTFEAHAQFRYGSQNTIESQGSVSGPLVKDKLLGRFSFDTKDSDGYYTNRFLGNKSVDYYHGYNFNARLLWRVDDDTTVDMKGRAGHVDAAAINYNAIFQLPGFASLLNDPYFNENANNHSYDYVGNVRPQNFQDSREVSAKLDHDFGWAKLTAWGLYSNIDNNFISDGTIAGFGFFNKPNANGVNYCQNSIGSVSGSGFQLPPPQSYGLLAAFTPVTCDGYQYQLRNQHDYSFEARLSAPADAIWRWSGGLYYLHIDRHVGVALGEDEGLPVQRALFADASTTNPTAQLFDDQFTTDAYAAFGSLAYNILPNVEVTAAIRYDDEERSVDNLVPPTATQSFINLTGGATSPLNPGLVTNPGGIPSKSKAFNQAEPKITIRWDIAPSLSAYAGYGVGFKSGGFNSSGSGAVVARTALFTSPTPADVTISDSYDKETSDAFEAGFKGTYFDKRLSWQVSGFYTFVHNLQFFEYFSTPFGLLRVVSNINEVDIGGFQLGAKYRLLDWLTLSGGFEYNDSNIASNHSRPDTVGNKSPYTPDYTGNISLQTTNPITDDLVAIGRLDVNFTGPTWFSTVQGQSVPSLFGLANYTNSERDAYQTVDLRVGIQGPNYHVVLFAKNLLDKQYPEEIIPAPEFGGSFVSPGPRRMLGIELGYEF